MYGAVPPLATRLELYDTPTSPVVAAAHASAGADATAMPHPLAVAEAPFASTTFAVKLNVPAVVGVPDKSPAEESVNPPGNAPALTLQV